MSDSLPPYMQGFVGSRSSRRVPWAEVDPLPSDIHWTNPPALGLEPQLQKWGSPTCRGQKDLESGDSSLPPVGVAPHLWDGATWRGALSEGLASSPPSHQFPGLIPRLPSRNPFLSTLKCFNLLHPLQRAPREAGRTPWLRAIKQLTAGGAERAQGGSREAAREIGGAPPQGGLSSAEY